MVFVISCGEWRFSNTTSKFYQNNSGKFPEFQSHGMLFTVTAPPPCLYVGSLNGHTQIKHKVSMAIMREIDNIDIIILTSFYKPEISPPEHRHLFLVCFMCVLFIVSCLKTPPTAQSSAVHLFFLFSVKSDVFIFIFCSSKLSAFSQCLHSSSYL